jgi:hypothetical protein
MRKKRIGSIGLLSLKLIVLLGMMITLQGCPQPEYDDYSGMGFTGRVTCGETGLPLSGVVISDVDGSGTYGSTDANGEYYFPVYVQDAYFLEFTYTSAYESKKYTHITSQIGLVTINITLNKK